MTWSVKKRAESTWGALSRHSGAENDDRSFVPSLMNQAFIRHVLKQLITV